MKNRIKIWQKNISILRQNIVLVDAIFVRKFLDDNTWKWLGFMKDEIEGYVSVDKKVFDLDRDFRFSVYEQVDFSLLEKINNNLIDLSKILVEGEKNSINKNKQILNLSSIESILDRLDIMGQTRQILLYRIGLVDKNNFSAASSLLSKLVIDYEKFKDQFLYVSAVLLYFTPEKQFNDYESFDKLTASLATQPALDKTEWYKIFRYLGQGFFSDDGAVNNWAVVFLTTTDITKDVWDNFIDRLLFVVLLYASLSKLKDLSSENQVVLLQKYLWWALVLGFPVERVLEESLSEEPLLQDYVLLCGHISQSISKSQQIMSFDPGVNITVGKFISDFVGKSMGRELEGYQQVSYIENFIKNNKNFTSYQSALIRLLRIYLHVREMDFVDYKGILSDEQIISPKYDCHPLPQKILIKPAKYDKQ